MKIRWLDSWIQKMVAKSLERELGLKEASLRQLDRDQSSLRENLDTLRAEIKGIENIALKVPIEEHVLHSSWFKEYLDGAIAHARQAWMPVRDPIISLPTLHGTVTDKNFLCYIEEDCIVLMAGMKIKYQGIEESSARYEMLIGDRRHNPFLVNAETKQIIFLKPHLIGEEYQFQVRRVEGDGTLEFSVLGALLSRRFIFDSPEFRVQPKETCFICGRMIHSKEAISDAKLLEKYTNQTSGILCCSCFKVAKAIIDGKQGGDAE